MSRSIHTNIRNYISELRNDYSDDGLRINNLDRIKQQLDAKRLIKKSKRLERKLSGMMYNIPENFDASLIDIRILDSGDYIHYPASKEDLLGVAERLPYGALLGINSIDLCFGREYQNESSENIEEKDRDPYTGRLCSSAEGPVYFPPILGSYFSDTCKIFIYSYVYDKEELKLDVIEPYLRLQMLSTFVHEVAHHDDYMRRTRRGRWLGLNEWKCEDYAELQQWEWSGKAIIPYLMEAYHDEYAKLSGWIKEHGGVNFPLNVLAGESRGRKIGDMVKLVFSASSAVEELFINVINDKPPRETMLEFAKGLHYGDYYEECLDALNTILEKYPKDAEALGVKADTYIHLQKYGEAGHIAHECLNIDENNIEALEALCDMQRKTKDWDALKRTSERGIRATEDGTWEKRFFMEAGIIASLYLGDYTAAKEFAEAYTEGRRQAHRKLAFESLVALLSGDIKKAVDAAQEILSKDDVVGPVKAIFKGILNKAVCEYGIDCKKQELTEYENNFLVNMDIAGLLGLDEHEST